MEKLKNKLKFFKTLDIEKILRSNVSKNCKFLNLYREMFKKCMVLKTV